MKLESIVVNFPVIVNFEFYGPSFGWSVSVNGDRYIRFQERNGIWEPQFYKLPHWITSADIEALRDLFIDSLNNHKGYPHLRVIKNETQFR